MPISYTALWRELKPTTPGGFHRKDNGLITLLCWSWELPIQCAQFFLPGWVPLPITVPLIFSGLLFNLSHLFTRILHKIGYE